MTVSVYMIYGSEGNRALIFVIVFRGAKGLFPVSLRFHTEGKNLEVVALKEVHEKLGH
jgi:hypothetical protein